MPSGENSPSNTVGKSISSILPGQLSHHSHRNYDHVAGLWQYENWLPEDAVALAKAHYAGYMVKRSDGLRVITLNTDMSAFL